MTNTSLRSDYEGRKAGREKRPDPWFTKSQVIPLCALLVAIVTTLLNWRGYTLNSESTIATNRALIAPVFGRWASPPVSGQPFELTLTYQNIGREPARNLTYFQEADYAPVIHSDDGDHFQIPAEDVCNKVVGELGSTVFAVTKNQYTLGLPRQKPLDPAVEKKQVVMLWRGCFKYETYQKRHFSSFCYWLRSDEGPITNWQWNFCPVENSFD